MKLSTDLNEFIFDETIFVGTECNSALTNRLMTYISERSGI
jgi:hypothetical protein